MNVTIVYPGTSETDALAIWCQALARHSTKHLVEVKSYVSSDDEIVFLTGTSDHYPREVWDRDIALLEDMKKPFGVIHSMDNPPVPTPGDYPSFVWTRSAREKIPGSFLVRQPTFPMLFVPPPRGEIHLGTFGRLEPKKATLQMAAWCRDNSLPFTAFTPKGATDAEYAKHVEDVGACVVTHPWLSPPESMNEMFDEHGITHFLFSNKDTRKGTGGSATAPRFASFFGRPIIVDDDDDVMAQDGCVVVPCLDLLTISMVEKAPLPSTAFGPDQYLDCLIREVTWRGIAR